MSSVNTAMNLASTAMDIYDAVVNGGESEESVGLIDMLLVAYTAAQGPGNFDSASLLGLLGTAVGAVVSPQGHHTIPVYLCGADYKQPRVKLPFLIHSKLHTQLFAGVGLLNKGFDMAFKRYLSKPGKGGRRTTDPIVRLAKKRLGREIIVKVLDYFYEVNGYKTAGVQGNPNLEQVFKVASEEFKKGVTSLPTCKR